MNQFIKNNIEIVIAVAFIVVVAGIVMSWDGISSLTSEPLGVKEEKLAELMKDRPVEQREVFLGRIEDAKEMLAENPDNPSAFEILGFLHDTLGDKETAQKYYIRVLKLTPESVPALNNLANIYSGQKKYSDADELYLEITEVDPSNIEAWRDLHDLYRYLYESKNDEADDILLLGLEKNPSDPQILAMLATYYQDQKETEKSIEYYQKLLQVMPENEAAKNELNKLLGL